MKNEKNDKNDNAEYQCKECYEILCTKSHNQKGVHLDLSCTIKPSGDRKPKWVRVGYDKELFDLQSHEDQEDIAMVKSQQEPEDHAGDLDDFMAKSDIEKLYTLEIPESIPKILSKMSYLLNQKYSGDTATMKEWCERAEKEECTMTEEWLKKAKKPPFTVTEWFEKRFKTPRTEFSAGNMKYAFTSGEQNDRRITEPLIGAVDKFLFDPDYEGIKGTKMLEDVYKSLIKSLNKIGT